jgi:hypothetical protein
MSKLAKQNAIRQVSRTGFVGDANGVCKNSPEVDDCAAANWAASDDLREPATNQDLSCDRPDHSRAIDARWAPFQIVADTYHAPIGVHDGQ